MTARTPIHFFTFAVLSFGFGVCLAPWVISDLLIFFYTPWLLAATHTFALGWISATIMGVMYRYAPALTKTPLRWPRLVWGQFVLFVIGVTGMVAHFALLEWVGLWSAAAVVVVSLLCFAANMLCCLAPAWNRGVAETGMSLSLLFFLGAAVLGLLLALNKTFAFLGGNFLTNLTAHAHLAALGWVSLTICAVSYRMIPAFLLSAIALPRAALWQIYALSFAILGLTGSLLSENGQTPFWGVAVGLALLAYVVVLGVVVRSHRLPIDWTTRHALAGVVCLSAAAGLGIALVMMSEVNALGHRLAGAYGVLGVLGWITNFIVGMSYQLFPGFVAGARASMNWPRLAVAELSLPRYRPAVFFALNAGLVIIVSGLVAAQTLLARLGAVIYAGGGLLYAAVTLWTLSYAYRRSIPQAAHTPLRVLLGDRA